MSFFVPIEMARNKTEPVFSASEHVPRHFKGAALVVSYPRFLGKRSRSERINWSSFIADTHYIGDSLRPNRLQQPQPDFLAKGTHPTRARAQQRTEENGV